MRETKEQERERGGNERGVRGKNEGKRKRSERDRGVRETEN